MKVASQVRWKAVGKVFSSEDNSLVAYPTACPVWEGADRKVPM